MSPTVPELRWRDGDFALYLAIAPVVLVLSAVPPIGLLARAPILAVVAVVLGLRPRLMASPMFWFGLAGACAITIALDPLGVGNHHFLGLYLCLATGLVLWDPADDWRSQWACNARWLLVGLMIFATLQKCLSPEYLRGDFWGYFLSFGKAGKLLFATGFWDGAVEVFRDNRNALAALGGNALADGSSAVLAEPFPHFRAVALFFTWATLAIEAALAAAFALCRNASWLLPHCLLIGFVVMLVVIRPELEFAALLLALGAIASPRRSTALHLSYAAGIALCLILSLLLQSAELGVAF